MTGFRTCAVWFYLASVLVVSFYPSAESSGIDERKLEIDDVNLSIHHDDEYQRFERSADKSKKSKMKKRDRRRKLAVAAVEKVVRDTMAKELEPLNIALSMIQFDTLSSGLVRQVSSLEHIQSNLLTEYGELRAAINEIGRHILDLGRQVAGMDERLANLDRQLSHRINVVNTRSESKKSTPDVSYLSDTLREAALTFSTKLTFAERSLKDNLVAIENRTVEVVKTTQNFLERRMAASAMETESRLLSIEKTLNKSMCTPTTKSLTDQISSSSDRFFRKPSDTSSIRMSPAETTKEDFGYFTPEERMMIQQPERLQREERQHPPMVGSFSGWRRPVTEFQTLNTAMVSKLASEVAKYIKMESEFTPKDCQDISSTTQKNGVYTIHPASCTKRYSLKVFCELSDAGGGWTVIQRRGPWSQSMPPGMALSSVFSPVDFFRDWVDYKWGFGNIKEEFWLGNEYIHQLTTSGNYELRIEMEDWNSEFRWAQYEHFYIENEQNNYTMHIGDYSGNAGNSLKQHDKSSFSTRDRDNDANPRGNCARTFHGAWWFTSCHEAHLNGKYHKGHHKSFGDGINWMSFRGHNYSLKKTRMMVRPAKKI